MAIKLSPKSELLIELGKMRALGIRPEGTAEFLDEEGNWKCTSCGACCEDVRWCLPEWVVEGTTRCKHLQDDKLCAIYEDRPWICKMSCFQKSVDKEPELYARACAYMRNKFRAPSDTE